MKQIPKNELLEKLENHLNIIDKYRRRKPKKEPDHVIHALCSGIFIFAKNILKAIKENEIFTACCLACSVCEAEILLLWINQSFPERAQDYFDFGIVETSITLNQNKKEARALKNKLEKRNCKRFFKKKNVDNNLLNEKNYNSYWYNTEQNSIKNITFILTKDTKEFLIEQKIIREDDDFKDILYRNYHLLCGFKHFSPLYTLTSFPIHPSFKEKPCENFAHAALIATSTALNSACIVLNEHGENIPMLQS